MSSRLETGPAAAGAGTARGTPCPLIRDQTDSAGGGRYPASLNRR